MADDERKSRDPDPDVEQKRRELENRRKDLGIEPDGGKDAESGKPVQMGPGETAPGDIPEGRKRRPRTR